MAKSINLTFISTLLFISLLSLTNPTNSDSSANSPVDQECVNQMQEMATCLPYVSGQAIKPTPECCADTEKARASNPKCLCLLIKESTDPSLGLPINTTLALHMPAMCNSDAKVSNCPSILNLSPNSPDAKIFEDATTNSSSPASSSSNSSSSHESSDSGSKTSSANGWTRFEDLLSVGFFGLMANALVLFI
ncbi:hypothetical protein LUZ60_009644 [Juncus effusus]|nr:hypothetical protein LUZ60_009644 [Juncus effusus]